MVSQEWSPTATTTEGEDCKGVLYEAIIILKDVKQSILISRKATE